MNGYPTLGEFLCSLSSGGYVSVRGFLRKEEKGQ